MGSQRVGHKLNCDWTAWTELTSSIWDVVGVHMWKATQEICIKYYYLHSPKRSWGRGSGIRAVPGTSHRILLRHLRCSLWPIPWHMAFQVAQWKRISLSRQETRVQSLVWQDPLEKEMATRPVFLCRKYHGQRCLVGYRPRGHKQSHTRLTCL